MATRRSRIKAVANLPARRNRPLGTSNTTNENLEDVDETSSPSKKVKNECSIKDIPPDVADSSLTPDRKSVIVTVEKDRKSVIVNRDHCISSTEPSITESPSSDKETEHGLTKIPSSSEKDEVGNASKSQNDENSILEVVKEADTVDIKSGATGAARRLPLRNRRTKPTVNLIAATRKRPANDLPVSSPCSPPPNKLKPFELLQRKLSETDNVPAANSDEKNKQVEASEPNEPGVIASTPSSSSAESNLCSSGKAAADSSEIFKTPANSPLKTKDNSQEAVGDISNTLDKTNSSPQKESSVKRKQSTNAQKVAAARKSLKSRLGTDGPLPRSSLTMFDLIFYNPSKNPMKTNDTTTKKLRDRSNSVCSISSIQEDRLQEESIDDIDGDGGKENTNDTLEETAMPVPQVKVGPDGSLILDEQSLVIETTGTQKSREELERSEVVIETGSSYGHYKKIIRSKDWSDHETKKFYRALNVVGTDFSLMNPYFRNRTRRELKLKFKKEEKLNSKLVNKALAEPLDFDISELEKECELEDEEEKRLEEMAKQKEAEKEAEKEKPCEVEKAKKPSKKKKSKCLAALEEILPNDEENAPDGDVVKKPAPKKRPKIEGSSNVKRDKTADADYDMLALGVDISKEEQVSSEVGTGPSPGHLPACKTSKAKRKIVPLSASSDSNVDSESHSCGLFDLEEEIPSKSSKKIKGETEDLGNNPQIGENCVKTKIVRISKKKPVKVLQEPTSSKTCIEGPSKINAVPCKELPASVSKGQTPSEPRLCPISSPTSGLGPKVFAIPSQLNIPAHSTPMRVPPLVGIGMTPPNAIQVVRRPVVQTTPNSSKPPITNIPPVCKLPQSTPLKTVQVPGSVLHTPPTPLVSSGPKMYPSTPLSKMRTIQVTPQSVQSPPGFSVPTPVSRLLPTTPPLPRMEPGSIIVLKTPLPQDPDRHVLQVYMVTNTPQGSSPNNAISITPHLPGINLLSGPSVQPASSRSPCISDESDSEKVLTKL